MTEQRESQIGSMSVADTESAGELLARELASGDVVLLLGELGAGKTAMVRGIVRGLGSKSHVSSPTYVFVHEYDGPVLIAHADLYRLDAAADVLGLGLDEYLNGSHIVLVEWPDRAGTTDWGPHWLVKIDVIGDERRRISIMPPAAAGSAG